MGGTLALAADAGHRVVLVFATRGDLGEVDDGVLAPDEALGERREQEARDAAAVLGAARVEFLPYHDSGMAGEPTNDAPTRSPPPTWRRPPSHLAAILREEHADVLTVYDERGGYGHPDHIQVHVVGRRAAALAGTPRVYAATMSKEHFLSLRRAPRRPGPAPTWSAPIPRSSTSACPRRASPPPSTSPPRSTASGPRWPRTRRRSPTSRSSSPCRRTRSRMVFGTEWFIRLDDTPPGPETWILDEPAP